MKTIYLKLMLIPLLLFFSCNRNAKKKLEKVEELVTTKTSENQLNATDSLPIDDELKIGELENGLKYYIRKNAKPEDKVELRLIVKAGSVLEDEDQLGLAHFVEHMAFNGSSNFEKNELINYLESVGAQFGSHLNAYTSFDETVYKLQIGTKNNEELMKGLLVLEDWASGISFDPNEINKEKGVVMSEWRTGLSPSQRMQQEYFPIMYYQSQYANRLPIGKPSIIEKANNETLTRFYKDWYRPNLMAVVAVGDFDPLLIENEIIKRFGKLKNPTTPRPKTTYSIPIDHEPMVKICTDDEATQTYVQLVYKHPNKITKSKNDVLNNLSYAIYNNMLNDRLDELSKKEDAPFTYASSWFGKDLADMSSFYSYAACQEDQVLQSLAALFRENMRIKKHGFTESEFNRTKNALLQNAINTNKESANIKSASFVGIYKNHFLNDSPAFNSAQKLALYEELLPQIDLQALNQLADKWIKEKGTVIVVSGPANKGLENIEEQMIWNQLKTTNYTELEAYVDNFVDAPLLPEILSTASIVKEEEADQNGFKHFELSNGVEIYHKTTDFKADQILVGAKSKGGYSLYDQSHYPTSDYIADIVANAGYGVFTANQLEKKLTGKKVGVSPYVNEDSEGFSAYCSPDELETCLQLIHLMMTADRKDEELFKTFKENEISTYEDLLADPSYYYWDQVYRISYNDHYRAAYYSDELLQKLDLNLAHKLYKERFLDADDFKFVFVGNVGEEKLKKLSAKYLGSLESLPTEESVGDLKMPLAKGIIKKTFRKGKAPKSSATMTLHGEFDYTSENRHLIRALVEVIRIRLRESLREDKGGVYGVQVDYSTTKFPAPAFSIDINFNADPGKAEELVAECVKQLNALVKEPINEELMQKIVSAQREANITASKSNGFYLSAMQKCLFNDIDVSIINQDVYLKLIEELNPSKIQEAAKSWLKMDNYIEIIMNPEE